MQVPTITMPADKAKEAYDQYRTAAKAGGTNKEDRAIMLGYKALASGKSILNLFDAFKVTGIGNDDRPRLAVARADLHHVYARTYWNGRIVLSSRSDFRRYRGYWFQEIPEGFLPRVERSADGVAVVPLIPPSVRPSSGLENYQILWEAAWQDVPTDPFLLRKLDGSLYVILAVWDLTDLERAVLRGRLREQS